MTDQEFENCRDALLMAAKMICDQPVAEFQLYAWSKWNVKPSRNGKLIAKIADACWELQQIVNFLDEPPQP